MNKKDVDLAPEEQLMEVLYNMRTISGIDKERVILAFTRKEYFVKEIDIIEALKQVYNKNYKNK